MRHTKTVSLLLAVALLTGMAVTLSGAAVAKTSKATLVGKDPVGDWGTNADPNLGPIGGPLGQDLTEAHIGAVGKNIVFIIKVASLPPNGGIPEGTRYTWEMTVGGKFVELDGKWSNYSRGTCDPTGGACPPPRNPGMQPFLVRGDCINNGATVQCKELGIVQATFDPGAGTITIPVPMAMLGAKPGTKIASATQPDSGFSGVNAAPSAFYSHSSAPYDFLIPTKVYTVPR